MRNRPEEFGPQHSGELNPADQDLSGSRGRWLKPRLRRIHANEAQSKGRPGVEFTRHLSS